MPKPQKYDETIFTKPVYWGKILMYNSIKWDTLYPLVDIIRILPANTIISNKYGKNQENIRLYGSQYNHNVVGCELKKNRDYINELKCVKFVFIYSDNQDTTADNLIKYCEISRTCYICYSNLDKLYHFYDFSMDKKVIHELNDPQKVINLMEHINSKGLADKLQELFPEFEITEQVTEPVTTRLQEALKILKEKNKEQPQVYKIAFDANFNKLKRLESSKKPVVYDDELPVKCEITLKKKNNLSQFFQKV